MSWYLSTTISRPGAPLPWLTKDSKVESWNEGWTSMRPWIKFFKKNCNHTSTVVYIFRWLFSFCSVPVPPDIKISSFICFNLDGGSGEGSAKYQTFSCFEILNTSQRGKEANIRRAGQIRRAEIPRKPQLQKWNRNFWWILWNWRTLS